MKAWKRVAIKFLILLLVIAGAGSAGIAFQMNKQSGPEHILNYYADKLINNDMDRAFSCLDNTKEVSLTKEEFLSAAEAKKFSLYAGYKLEKLQEGTKEDGTAFVDYKLTFVNTAEEPQAEENVTVVKETEKKYFFFEQWAILPDHCMVQDFMLTVPQGSEVTIDGTAADTAWLVTDQETQSETVAGDTYRIPQILPGTSKVTVYHPALNDMVQDVDTTKGDVSLCGKAELNEASKSACLELGIKSLKELYKASITDDNKALTDVFADCKKEAEAFVTAQKSVFTSEEGSDISFVSLAVSGFNPQFAEVVASESDKGGITVTMSLAYHYLAKYNETVYVETGEYDENWDPIMDTSTQENSQSGDSTAMLTMTYYDKTWHLTGMEVPEVLQ